MPLGKCSKKEGLPLSPYKFHIDSRKQKYPCSQSDNKVFLIIRNVWKSQWPELICHLLRAFSSQHQCLIVKLLPLNWVPSTPPNDLKHGRRVGARTKWFPMGLSLLTMCVDSWVTTEFKCVFGLLSFYFIVCVCSVASDPLGPCGLYSLPGSSVHGISQSRILEGVAHSYTRGSSQPRNQTHNSCISCIGRQFLYHYSIWEAPDASQIHHLISCFITHPWKHISYFLVWSSGSFELHPASSRGYEDQYFRTQHASTDSLGSFNLCVAGVAGLLWAHIFLAWDPLWRKIQFYTVPQTDPNSSLTNEKWEWQRFCG